MTRVHFKAKCIVSCFEDGMLTVLYILWYFFLGLWSYWYIFRTFSFIHLLISASTQEQTTLTGKILVKEPYRLHITYTKRVILHNSEHQFQFTWNEKMLLDWQCDNYQPGPQSSWFKPIIKSSYGLQPWVKSIYSYI